MHSVPLKRAELWRMLGLVRAPALGTRLARVRIARPGLQRLEAGALKEGPLDEPCRPTG
jgi:hypothetical protein